MKTHTDCRLQVTPKHQAKTPYAWCINEINEHGQTVGEDLIPYSGSIVFTAKEISVRDDLEITEPYNVNFGIHEQDLQTLINLSANFRYKRRIMVGLHPGLSQIEKKAEDSTQFRMLGSSRLIEKFDLTIVPADDESDTMGCYASGFVRYTTENENFTDRIEDDCIGFHLTVKPSIFERYVDRI